MKRRPHSHYFRQNLPVVLWHSGLQDCVIPKWTSSSPGGIVLNKFKKKEKRKSLKITVKTVSTRLIVAVYFRFNLHSRLNLKPVLNSLGISDAFNPHTADFRGISGRYAKPLIILCTSLHWLLFENLFYSFHLKFSLPPIYSHVYKYMDADNVILILFTY